MFDSAHAMCIVACQEQYRRFISGLFIGHPSLRVLRINGMKKYRKKVSSVFTRFSALSDDSPEHELEAALRVLWREFRN